jgi:hypothetical protein
VSELWPGTMLKEEGSVGRRQLVLRRGPATGSSVALSEQTTAGGALLAGIIGTLTVDLPSLAVGSHLSATIV